MLHLEKKCTCYHDLFCEVHFSCIGNKILFYFCYEVQSNYEFFQLTSSLTSFCYVEILIILLHIQYIDYFYLCTIEQCGATYWRTWFCCTFCCCFRTYVYFQCLCGLFSFHIHMPFIELLSLLLHSHFDHINPFYPLVIVNNAN